MFGTLTVSQSRDRLIIFLENESIQLSYSLSNGERLSDGLELLNELSSLELIFGIITADTIEMTQFLEIQLQ
jgi:hypothetical protein